MRWRVLEIFAACALGSSLGFVTYRWPLYGVLALGSVLVGSVVVFKPLIGIIAFLLLRSSIAYETLPIFTMTIGGLYLSDFVLLFLLAWMSIRLLAQPTAGRIRSPFTWPILLLNMIAWISTSMALAGGLDPRQALRELRIVGYYTLFFPIAYFINDREALSKLVRVLRLIAIGVAAASLIQVLLGPALGLKLVWAGRVLAYSSGQTDMQRATAPGTVLVYWMFLLAFCRLIIDQRNLADCWWSLVEASLLGVALLLTFTRTIWCSLVFPLVLLTLGTSTSQRVRLVRASVGAGIAILAGLFLLSGVSKYLGLTATYGNAILERAAVLSSVEKLSSHSSFEYRWMETRYAWRAILEHPFLGIGAGSPYRPPMNMDEARNRPSAQLAFVHNAYLWVWLKLGVGGLMALVWLALVALLRSWHSWRGSTDPFLAAILAACCLTLAGQLLVNLFWEYLFSVYSVPVLATLLAVCNTAFGLGGYGSNQLVMAQTAPATHS